MIWEAWMRFGCAISQEKDTLAAADAVIADILEARLNNIDVLFVFLAAAHTAQAEELLQRLHDGLSPSCVVGASAEGVIGGDQELERTAGLALLAGEFGAASVKSFHFGRDDWRKLLMQEDALGEALGYSDQTRGLIGFGDPFSTPLRQLMEKLH